MKNRVLLSLVGLLVLSPTAFAQGDPPYYQEHRMVVVFGLADDLYVRNFDGSPALALQRGTYRFDATRKSQAILNASTLADGSGPFVGSPSILWGTLHNLGTGHTREARMSLELTEADLGVENIVMSGELTLQMRVQLGMTSTQTHHSGDVRSNGTHVTGWLERESSQSGKIDVHHVKVSLNDDHVPVRLPEAFFPQYVAATVTNVPVIDPDDEEFEIPAGPWGFTLVRDGFDEAGAMGYRSSASFPMVEEDDFHGSSRSMPHDATVVAKGNGDVWVRFGWGLTGRNYGWSYETTVILDRDALRNFRTLGSVTLTGQTSYQYVGEEYDVELDTPCEVELSLSRNGPIATSQRGEVEVVGGEVEINDHRIQGMLTEALRALEGETVTANGELTLQGGDRELKVTSFVTELRSDARGIGGGKRVLIPAGTEVEVLRTWSRYARVRYDDNGAPRGVTISLQTVAPTDATGMLGGVSTP